MRKAVLAGANQRTASKPFREMYRWEAPDQARPVRHFWAGVSGACPSGKWHLEPWWRAKLQLKRHFCSDSCGSNSPALYEQHPILGRNFSRSDSVDVNAARNSNNTDLNDILVSIFLSKCQWDLLREILLLEPVVSKWHVDQKFDGARINFRFGPVSTAEFASYSRHEVSTTSASFQATKCYK